MGERLLHFQLNRNSLDDDTEDDILDEIESLGKKKGITRFISTHPDDDHIRGLEKLDDRIGILNFYCVKNTVTKEDETDSFTRYLRTARFRKEGFLHQQELQTEMDEPIERGTQDLGHQHSLARSGK
jgi:beta-lactamase superfamily II metal-dependent hydrolase